VLRYRYRYYAVKPILFDSRPGSFFVYFRTSRLSLSLMNLVAVEANSPLAYLRNIVRLYNTENERRRFRSVRKVLNTTRARLVNRRGQKSRFVIASRPQRDNDVKRGGP